MTDVTDWLKNGKYLPQPLRDFHRQKSLFKYLDSLNYNWQEPVKKPDWITAHCYVIDIFLWVMARHGYTLQKSRQKVFYNNLIHTLDEFNQRQSEVFFAEIDKQGNKEVIKND